MYFFLYVIYIIILLCPLNRTQHITHILHSTVESIVGTMKDPHTIQSTTSEENMEDVQGTMSEENMKPVQDVPHAPASLRIQSIPPLKVLQDIKSVLLVQLKVLSIEVHIIMVVHIIMGVLIVEVIKTMENMTMTIRNLTLSHHRKKLQAVNLPLQDLRNTKISLSSLAMEQ